ncbi:isochorismatase family protein [Bdellovibrio sp. HCB290]|uniref:isochorismatase family protein n=1 Tax=Bdellovibrio sp. HCB290 TaxID=3394356 RepID=UPI0039B39A70
MSSFLLIFLISSVSLATSHEACSENAGNSALFIIDMQSFFKERTGTHKKPENQIKLEELHKQQLLAIAKARESGISIVFIEYLLGPESGSTDYRLKDAVRGYTNTRTFQKTSDGMFHDYNTFRDQLISYIKQNNIGTLLVMGANGGSCVEASILQGLNRGCRVVAYNKGIADFNYRDFVYPYAGLLGQSMEPFCKDQCDFKETSSIDFFENQMRFTRGSTKTSPQRSQPATR